MDGPSGPMVCGFWDRLQIELIACVPAWARVLDACEVCRVPA